MYEKDKRLILDFKSGKKTAIRHFIVRALQFLEFQEMDEEIVILRPLSSGEMSVIDECFPLDRLGNSLATVFDCTYYPEILAKTRGTRPMKSLNFRQRQTELKNVYRLTGNTFNFNDRKVLIIDDVVTTGATACAVMKAIFDAFPDAKIDVLSLAWTPTADQQAYIEEHYTLKDQVLNEPEMPYGSSSFVDDDFENGKTNISLFP